MVVCAGDFVCGVMHGNAMTRAWTHATCDFNDVFASCDMCAYVVSSFSLRAEVSY